MVSFPGLFILVRSPRVRLLASLGILCVLSFAGECVYSTYQLADRKERKRKKRISDEARWEKLLAEAVPFTPKHHHHHEHKEEHKAEPPVVVDHDWNETVERPKRGISGRQKALISLSYWKDVEHQRRLPCLLNTLLVFSTYTVEVDAILVTNVGIKEAQRLVVGQVIRPKPNCSSYWSDHVCVPWEAINVLRYYALKGRLPGESTFDLSGPNLPELTYDYYMYWEGDIEIPADSFNFWRMHVENMWDRGYYLLPYRLEMWVPSGKVIFTDWVGPENDCGTAYYDDAPPADAPPYEDFRDSVYVRIRCNPYAAGFMLTKRLYKVYNATTAWDYHHYPYLGGPWWIRESATVGLLQNWFHGLGNRHIVNHERVYTKHQQVMHNIFPAMYGRTDFQDIILDCVVNRTCAPMMRTWKGG